MVIKSNWNRGAEKGSLHPANLDNHPKYLYWPGRFHWETVREGSNLRYVADVVPIGQSNWLDMRSRERGGGVNDDTGILSWVIRRVVVFLTYEKIGKRTCLKEKRMSSAWDLLRLQPLTFLQLGISGWKSLTGSWKRSTKTVGKVQARPLSLEACVSRW